LTLILDEINFFQYECTCIVVKGIEAIIDLYNGKAAFVYTQL